MKKEKEPKVKEDKKKRNEKPAKQAKEPKPKKEKPVKAAKPAKMPKKSARWIDLYSRDKEKEIKWTSCSNCGYIATKAMSESLDTCPICSFAMLKEDK